MKEFDELKETFAQVGKEIERKKKNVSKPHLENNSGRES